MRYLKKFESILKPHRLEDRVERLRKEIKEELTNETLGELKIDSPIYLELDSNVKEVTGNLFIRIEKIPEWVKEIKVNGTVWINSKMDNLENSPNLVGGDFWCNYIKLKSLKGAPEKVGGDFWCSGNYLTSLEGAPKWVGGDFWCHDNPVLFTIDDVKSVSNVKGFSTTKVTR